MGAYMTKLLAPDMETLEEWADQLGVPFERVLKKAGVTDPTTARASRMRMRSGGAPRVRQALVDVLLEYEKQRERPTSIGALFMGLQEWRRLGAELAEVAPEAFLKLLDGARARVESARAAQHAERTFFPDEDE